MTSINTADIRTLIDRISLGSKDGDRICTIMDILNYKYQLPLEISLSSNVITINASTLSDKKSDGSDGLEDTYKKSSPPINRERPVVSQSTLDLTDGSTTGDFGTLDTLSLTASYWVNIGLELRKDEKIYVVYSEQKATEAELQSPTFSLGALPLGIITVQDSGSGGSWNFNTVDENDIERFPLGGGAGGGAGSTFIPITKNDDKFTIQGSDSLRVLLNNKKYYLSDDLDIDYNKTADGTWYIAIDTSKSEGELDSTYIYLTQTNWQTNSWNSEYIPIGEYVVSSGSVSSLTAYSERWFSSWIFGLPNDELRTDQVTSSGNKTFNFSNSMSKKVIIKELRFWDNSASSYTYWFDKASQIVSMTDTQVVYNVPASLTFNTGDYFECIVELKDEIGTGFASPKSDNSTSWYTSTPSNTIAHGLTDRPLAITLEFNDNGKYYIEDGNQYINKSATTPMDSTNVTFDWTGLPTLSATMQMKIHFHLSKISAGAFEAQSDTLGCVKVLGNTTLPSPDLILDSSHTSFATQINALADNSWVHIKENITVTANQAISKKIKLTREFGAKIICATALTSILSINADSDIDVEIEAQEDITNAIEFNSISSFKGIVSINASGKTLTNAIKVNTGYKVIGDLIPKQTSGTITNEITDTDSNSQVRYI